MELRKRTGNGKSTKHEMTEKLRVVARDKVNKTLTFSFELGKFHGTVFNITMNESEKEDLIDQMLKE